jgi:recombination protein RecT
MSTDAKGQQSVALTPFQAKVSSIRTLLDRAKGQIKLALPRHIDPDRLLRIAMTSVQKTPELLDCNPQSLLACPTASRSR